ncbi:hypothetical protein DSCA_28060 [Desulfosarcina alkanivorans]|uniref:Heavy-metal chelation domain-containing protein n=1 Tax=Desulfosarcina alkanivorans TaxID=571177 RepID=A0A5K7YIA3_9BACT|nr:DUF364 domain-containing protein [Desulfosarcina alkanivorans]BBO68876.1 hypothetical protein DSCA_28060 [Desulfosarcina alkanivorans]
MELNRKLYACMSAAAARVTIDQVTIGLGYTAVTTSDGGIGIAATCVARDGGCAGQRDATDFEGRPAIDLLGQIMEAAPMGRTMALATVNALNHRYARKLPEDPGNTLLFDHFNIRSGARVAMVGYFPPLVRRLEKQKISLSVVDDARGMGDKKTFYGQLDGWADVLLITATSIINNSTETVLAHAGPDLKTVLLGPSTPMVPEAYGHLPVHMLAGTDVTDVQGALKIVRHGGGTRALKPVSRKIYWLADTDPR